MQKLKTITTSIVVAGLLAGSAVGVAAQDEEAADVPTGSAWFTGTYEPVNPPTTFGSETTSPDGITWMAGQVHEGETVETSDRRLSGSLTRVVNWAHLGPNRDFLVETQAWHLENDGGSWIGEGTSIIHSATGTPPSSFLTIDLTGAGAYGGLTAVVLVDGTENPYAIEGAVIAGELMPVSEPPAG